MLQNQIIEAAHEAVEDVHASMPAHAMGAMPEMALTPDQKAKIKALVGQLLQGLITNLPAILGAFGVLASPTNQPAGQPGTDPATGAPVK